MRRQRPLWKQLVLSSEAESARASSGCFEALVFALAAAAAIQLARLAGQFPEEEAGRLLRNISLFVLPFVAGCRQPRAGRGQPDVFGGMGHTQRRRRRRDITDRPAPRKRSRPLPART